MPMQKTHARLIRGLLFTILLAGGCRIMTQQTTGAQQAAGTQPATGHTIDQIPGQAPPGTVEIHGVAAGEFNPAIWQKNTLHIVPDFRSPLLAPRLSGMARNIYAPSPVELPGGGWRVFYGAWDGVPTMNDRIYSVETPDFLDFNNRHMVIDHGEMIHACNVNALRLPTGEFAMVCTLLPEKRGNYPAFFKSPDGKTWNGDPEPHPAKAGDIVNIEGYPNYDTADINGMNVILFEDGVYRLYFGDFKQFGKIYRATSTDGHNYKYEGVCLEAPLMVNDMKKFTAEGKTWYLMGLHHNSQHLFYALSNDGMKFEKDQEMAHNLGDADKYIVANGWVTRDNRVLGFLYGAGEHKGLSNNRIFARWLQKKVVFVAEDGTRYEGTSAMGPDRVLIDVPREKEIKGHFEVTGEDGTAPVVASRPAKIASGYMFEVK